MSCKLDGVSGLYSTENGELKLYTRGDGTVGQDISHFLPYLKLPKVDNTVVRGEFIMTKAIFNAKYKDHFANPRNLIAGTINRLTVNDVIYDIHFVAYEVLVPSLSPSAQMAFLQNNGFNAVRNGVRPDKTNELLSWLLVLWRGDYEYEIDGVIVTNDKIYPRKVGNPDHSFAFKMVLSDQMAETKVVDVHWTASKDGYLKPRVQIEPVHLSGVKIEFATGFNGAFIRNNRIGVGALINIIRSGDVIPYIKDVITPADEGKMPSVP
jgi:NAD-dependent DNA ligase